MKIKTLEVAGFGAAVQALRLPFTRECRSKVSTKMILDEEGVIENPHVGYTTLVDFDEKDLKLMKTLIKRGDEHAKVIRGIIAYAEIEAPRFWWQEADTYRVGADKLSSESTMHTLGNRPLTVDNFAVNDVVRQCLKEKESSNFQTELHFDVPDELRSVIIERYGRKYEVWNNGEIYALEFISKDQMPDGTTRERVFPKTKLKLGHTRTKSGYFQVGIGGRKGKVEMVHRIMAEAFVPNPDKKPFVNHKDGNKGNCSPSNLEWCTSKENNDHARTMGLNKSTIRAKYLAYKNALKYSDEEISTWVLMKEAGLTYDEIATSIGVPKSVIENYVLYDGEYNASPYRSDFRSAFKLEETIAAINELASLYNESKEASLLYDIKALMPESFIQKRIECFSYQCLRNIVKQRKGHRLPEWATFIEWVRSLPFANELIFVGLENDGSGTDN